MNLLLVIVTVVASARAYWLMGIEDFITTERLDPLVSPGKVASHVHSVLGGSNFRMTTNTSFLRQSECSSIPIPQDKSAYWFPHLYFQWNNGSFTSLNGGAVICPSAPEIIADPHQDYLFSDTPGTTTAFPDDFRMLSGDPTLRTYNESSHAQQAVTFLCLDFNGVSTKYNMLPPISCPSGIRAQINFPSCWDGKNVDSPDHKSHVAFLSGGPDTGTCSDPNFPVVIPRIFMELYWSSSDFDSVRSQARNATQPFVYSYGDPTGYGYHADFINGWDAGVLQKAVDGCNCNPYGDATCCVNKGLFDMDQGKNCRITKAINEQTTGTLLKLPGNNPVQPEGKKATIFADTSNPELLSPIFAYTGDSPTATGTVVDASQNTPSSSPAATGTQTPTVVATPTDTSAVQTPTAAPTTATTSPAVPASPSSTPTSTPRTTTTTPRGVTTSTKPGFTIPSIVIPTIVIPTFTFPHILAPGASGAAAEAASPTAVPAAAGGSTCKKKKRAMEKVRRNPEAGHFQLHHVRHLDYVYDDTA
ncbi:hypothetical protein D9619_004538 [Psilocybe cf. subviscida]|uniref:DUF1996 domain-containing protein n=1 Tax=Psilocybe cf. subviscida TaxID=2480587 RepID=A0A8H5BSV3_9AGAR|nr:hypothetical protein D9619_004538 [Psilocybe cf. subviscida]